MPGQLGWTSNRFLIAAVTIEGGIAAAFLLVPGLASLLDHDIRTYRTGGRFFSAPIVLAADALYKTVARRTTAKRS